MLGPLCFGWGGRAYGVGRRLLGLGVHLREGWPDFERAFCDGCDARARFLCKNAFWLCPMIRC
jgi:hypothetical protein